MSVIAAQLDPNEEGKNRFFSRNQVLLCMCVCCCACRLVRGILDRFTLLLFSQSVLSLRVCKAVRVLDIYRRLATGQAGRLTCLVSSRLSYPALH